MALAAAILAALPAAAQEPELRFLTPRHLATAIGPTAIEVEARWPAGAALERVELHVDGALVATWTEPPFRYTFDAGDGSRGHLFQATLVLAGGRTNSTTVRTSPLRINQYEDVDLVNIFALVRDPGGAYVTGLERGDFRVRENGVEQQITNFTAERKPLRVAIVLDTSLSMSAGKGTKLKNAKNSALEFLSVLRPGDEAMVVVFNDGVEVVQDLTSDVPRLASAITAAESRGGTALYDAIWRAALKLEGFDGRRVMVLLSDGRDEAYAGLQPGSLHTLDEAIDQALRCEVMVFAIGLGKNLDQQYVIRWDRNLFGQSNLDSGTSLGSILRRVADVTGGRALISVGTSQLRKAFANVADDLGNHYSLGYVSSDETRDGRWREIEVSTVNEKLEVIARKGYYAPGPERAR
jgi:VWFA-related protein